MKKEVRFVAKKKVTEPVEIKFKTTDGKVVKFVAKKSSIKPVKVKFKTKK